MGDLDLMPASADMEDCPDCGGRGVFMAPGTEFDVEPTPVECERCRGTGAVRVFE
jgi:DnaJ-class molecular chaperone